MSSWFWRPILKLSKRRFPVNLLTQSIFCRKTFSLLSAISNLQILWIKYNSKQTRFSSKFEYCQYFLSLLNELTIVSVFLKKFVLVISYENYWLNTFSFLSLDLQPRKRFFEVLWHQKPSFSIVWRHMLSSILIENVVLEVLHEKTIVYKSFYHLAPITKQENNFLRCRWRYNEVTTPKIKNTTGCKQFSDLCNIGNNILQSKHSEKKHQKIWKSDCLKWQ